MNCGGLLFRDASGSQRAKAKRLRVSQTHISQMGTGAKLPGAGLRILIEREYGIRQHLWDEPATASAMGAVASPPTEEEQAPSERNRRSSRSNATAEELPGSEGSPLERALSLLEHLAQPGLTPLQLKHAQCIQSAIKLHAQMVGALSTKQALHQHPDFDAFCSRLIAAFGDMPDALERLETVLDPSTTERASEAA